MGERSVCLSYLMVNYKDLDEIYKIFLMILAWMERGNIGYCSHVLNSFKTIFLPSTSNFFQAELPTLLHLLAVSN
jgi:hypothetical protein